MMSVLTSTDFISLTDAPTRPERILADRKAQAQRAMFGSAGEEIPCPGGCGSMASLESPLVVTRKGVTRTIQIAQCLGECRREVKSRSGKIRYMAARFELPCQGQGEEDSVVSADTSSAELSSVMARALQLSGMRQSQAAAAMGCSQSVISKMLHGYPVAAKTATMASRWAQTVIDAEARGRNVTIPTAPGNGHTGKALPARIEDPQPDAHVVSDRAAAPRVELAGNADLKRPAQASVAQATAPRVEEGVARTVEPPEEAIAEEAVAANAEEAVAANAEAAVDRSAEEAVDAGSPVPIAPADARVSVSPSQKGFPSAVIASTPDEIWEHADVAPQKLANPRTPELPEQGSVGATLDPPEPLQVPRESRSSAAPIGLDPYETVLRRVLEDVAQCHLQQIAGPAAEGVRVRVTLEWSELPRT
jgi:hypothetical protein